MTDNTQNPGGWPDAEEERLWALAPAHLRVLVDRRIAAREAAARREGIEACAARCDTREVGWGGICGYREQEAADCAAAIRALLEDGR